MIAIFIDTSLSYINLAIFRNNKLLDFINEYCDKDLSKLFDVRVRELLGRNNIDFKDINEIYAVTGPGSFTGIRIGLTFAKVLGMSLNMDIIPVSELEVLASGNCSKYVVPLIDARRGFVYAGIYDCNLNNVVSDKYVLLDDFLSGVDVNDVSFVSYNSFYHINTIKPFIDYEKIINKERGKVNYHLIVPKYLKMTEAEENLKKKMVYDN